MAKKGKLHLTPEMGDLMKRYPRGLDEQERSKAESLIRASMLGMAGLPGAPNETSGWTRPFWQQNRCLSPCKRAASLVLTDEDEPEEDLDGEEPVLLTSVVSAGFIEAVESLENDVRELHADALHHSIEPYGRAPAARLGGARPGRSAQEHDACGRMTAPRRPVESEGRGQRNSTWPAAKFDVASRQSSSKGLSTLCSGNETRVLTSYSQ